MDPHERLCSELKKHPNLTKTIQEAPPDHLLTLIIPADSSMPSMMAGIPHNEIGGIDGLAQPAAAANMTQNQGRIIALMEGGVITYFTSSEQLN
jgi:hypothetical protein